MGIYVPSIEDLVVSEMNSLKDKKKLLVELENDPNINKYPLYFELYDKISKLKREIKQSENLLLKFRKIIRDKKFKDLGI